MAPSKNIGTTVACDFAIIRAVKARQPGSIACPKGFVAVETVPPGNTPIAPPSAKTQVGVAIDQPRGHEAPAEVLPFDVIAGRALRARAEPGNSAVLDQQCRSLAQAIPRIAVDTGEIDIVE